MKWNQRRVHGSHIVTVALERPSVSHIMSIKIVDILKACKQRQVEQALGLVEARNRYGGVERTSNMQVPPSWNMSSITEDSSSFSTNPSLSTQSQHVGTRITQQDLRKEQHFIHKPGNETKDVLSVFQQYLYHCNFVLLLY